MDALGYRADVPSRAREATREKVQSVEQKVVGGGRRAKREAQHAESVAQENPLGLTVGSVAVGSSRAW